ncbi:hypothetical protein FOZ61_010902 [Perkinsus olseni]|uniref:GAF domain-containing protein n=1 Tax=Perkinsus olseni TaxID=32597 RepID=A0A7J6KWK3_PEROL|nr:hypothetical protein FOZ61_010902 [Perkinsus olseni]
MRSPPSSLPVQKTDTEGPHQKLFFDFQKGLSDEMLQKLEDKVINRIQEDPDLTYRFNQVMRGFRTLLERDRRGADSKQKVARLIAENEVLRKRSAGQADKLQALRAEHQRTKETNDILAAELVMLKNKALERDKKLNVLEATSNLLLDSLEEMELAGSGSSGGDGLLVALRQIRRQLARNLHQQLVDEQEWQRLDMEHQLVLAKNKALVKELALANTNTGTHVTTSNDLLSDALSKVRAARRISCHHAELFMSPCDAENESAPEEEDSVSSIAEDAPTDLAHVTVHAANDKGDSEKDLPFEPIYAEAITEPHKHFLERLFAARGEYLFEHLHCSGIPEDQRPLALQLVAKEMSVAEVFSDLLSEICSCLECDRATLWIVDAVRRVLWARVPKGGAKTTKPGSLMTLEVPIPSDGVNEKVGIIASAYASREVVSISDAYADPRFNPQADLATGYRTNTILAVPVMQDDRVVAVIQGINKKTAKEFDDDDQFLLKMWGSVASAIVIRNERLTSSAWRLHRMALLAKFTKACSESTKGVQDIVSNFEKSMRALFGADTTRVHLVYGDHTARIIVDVVNNSYELEESEGFQGLVGLATRSRCPHATSSSGDGSPCDPNFDSTVDIRIPNYSPVKVFTIPLIENQATSLIIASEASRRQNEAEVDALAPRPSGAMNSSTEGTYDPRNEAHTGILLRLAQMASFRGSCHLVLNEEGATSDFQKVAKLREVVGLFKFAGGARKGEEPSPAAIRRLALARGLLAARADEVCRYLPADVEVLKKEPLHRSDFSDN